MRGSPGLDLPWAGPQVSSWQDEQGSVLVSKAYKEHMHYLCSPGPGVTVCSTKAKMTVIRMDLHSVTQGEVKTWEDNRERKRQHTPQNSDAYNLNEETSS